ncbi:MAG: PHP domain-containing protein [Pseudohongiella sp.]|nr:PHP domain-containing protein [Pseudohongiella sp.]
MIDLHSHTWLSDGDLSPLALAERAVQLGIRQLAITDHDSIAAHFALKTFVSNDFQLLTGVEISTNWEGREVHLVGLLFDLEDTALTSLLVQQQQLRWSRADNLGIQMEKAGMPGLSNYLQQLPCESVGRTHIAEYMVKAGYVGSKQLAFSKYLGKRGRFQTSIPWCDLQHATQILRQAGGLTVLAHPDRYDFNRARLKRLISVFAEAGGDAIEVSYSNLHPEKMSALAEHTLQAGLWASVGSDFHTPSNTWMDLGRIRQLPPSCAARAIWYHPRWNVALPANAPAVQPIVA